jgi:hypothetical protein
MYVSDWIPVSAFAFRKHVCLLQNGIYCLQTKPRNLNVYVYTFNE